MKKYLKEIVILLIQLFVFYAFPLFAGPTDVIGMVLSMILTTFVLSFVMGLLSKEKIKYFYPIVVAILFVPTIFIYYNSSACVHIVWYFVVATVGLVVGAVFNKLVRLESK